MGELTFLVHCLVWSEYGLRACIICYQNTSLIEEEHQLLQLIYFGTNKCETIGQLVLQYQ